MTKRFGLPVVTWILVGIMIVAALGIVVFVDRPSSGNSVNDVSGCSGLTNYEASMNQALENFHSVITKAGLVDVFSLSPDEMTQLSKDTDAFHTKLKAIHPPSWAKDWHASQIEKVGLFAQFVRSSIKNDVLTSGMMFGTLIGSQGTAESVAVNLASGTCAQFATFASQWSSDYQDVGVPTS